MKANYVSLRFQFKHFVLVLLVGFLFIGNVFSQTYNRDYQDGRLYFKFKDNIALNVTVGEDNSVELNVFPFIAALQRDFRIKSLQRPYYLNNDPKLLRTFMLEFEDYDKIEQILNRIAENDALEYVERVPCDRIYYTPNDTLYNMSNGPSNWNWHLDRIQAQLAWDITKGSEEIKLAIVDNAVWVDHPDLTDKVVAQRDTYYNTNNANPPGTGDPYSWSHGTHCAGLAAASTDNAIGVASIGHNVSIIAVKAAKNTDPESIYGYPGIQWAANNGADIISMSWGGSGYSQTNQNIITSIYNMGIVLLAAAGNDNVSTPHYPSSFSHVISIASTNGNDQKSDFSNYGSTVDLCAPGGINASGPSGLLSTTFSSATYGNYDLMAGTSMATPVAAGLAGLILSVNPDLGPDEVEDIMKSTSDDVYTANPDYIDQLGAGRINAYHAVLNTPFTPVADFSTPLTIILPNTSINFSDQSKGVPSQWQWTFAGGTPATSTEANPSGIMYTTPGTYEVVLTVTNDFGTNTKTVSNYITVTTTPLPVIFISASDTIPCIGDPVSIYDSSLYDPTSWEWWFEPATVAYINGTSANSQHPEVSFLNSGKYTLGLRIWNANGMSEASYTNFFNVGGALPGTTFDMENGTSDYLVLWDTTKSKSGVDARAAFESNFGVHFQGDLVPTGWKGGGETTTAEQAWVLNKVFQSEAYLCGVDASGLQYLVLALDLKQTYSLGSRNSWFRVLVNGEQIPDNHGTMDFNPITASNDPWTRLYFDLSAQAGTVFDITLQSSCRFSDNTQGAGDNVFVDNIEIRNTTFTDISSLEAFNLAVFPNPSDGEVKVNANTTGEKVVVSISSPEGRIVYEKIFSAVNGRISQSIDLTALTPGIYILSLNDNKRITNQKIVIK